MKIKQYVKAELDARLSKEQSDALWSKAERKLDEIMKDHAGILKGEHALGWTFLVCPIAGLIVAGIVALMR